MYIYIYIYSKNANGKVRFFGYAPAYAHETVGLILTMTSIWVCAVVSGSFGRAPNKDTCTVGAKIDDDPNKIFFIATGLLSQVWASTGQRPTRRGPKLWAPKLPLGGIQTPAKIIPKCLWQVSHRARYCRLGDVEEMLRRSVCNMLGVQYE